MTQARELTHPEWSISHLFLLFDTAHFMKISATLERRCWRDGSSTRLLLICTDEEWQKILTNAGLKQTT